LILEKERLQAEELKTSESEKKVKEEADAALAEKERLMEE
jgi:hypothetical protein